MTDDLMRALAQRTRDQQDEGDRALEQSPELAAPMDTARREALEAHLLNLVSPSPAEADQAEEEADRAAPRSSSTASARWRRWLRWWPVLPVPVAAAAAALLWLAPPPAALPAYGASWEGGRQALRDAPTSTVLRFVPGDTYALVLRPDEAVADTLAGKLAVRARVQTDEGTTPLPLSPAERAPTGAIRLKGSTEAWDFLAVGPHTVTVWIGPAEALSDLPPPPSAPVRRLDLQVERLPSR